VGVLAEKVWLLAAGQAEPWLALPQGSYFPTWVEFLAVIGAISLGVIIYLLLAPAVAGKKEA
jgi:Ni/Fe-hydrogenase subunit HybB-like protein